MPSRTRSERAVSADQLAIAADALESATQVRVKKLTVKHMPMSSSSCCSFSCLIKLALLPMMCVFLVNTRNVIDEQIDGRWREYPPFNLFDHPPLEAYSDTKTIVAGLGFELHDHWVTTEDGYILNLVNLRPKN